MLRELDYYGVFEGDVVRGRLHEIGSQDVEIVRASHIGGDRLSVELIAVSASAVVISSDRLKVTVMMFHVRPEVGRGILAGTRSGYTPK